jgi:hypothetical protein
MHSRAPRRPISLFMTGILTAFAGSNEATARRRIEFETSEPLRASWLGVKAREDAGALDSTNVCGFSGVREGLSRSRLAWIRAPAQEQFVCTIPWSQHRPERPTRPM